MTLTLRIRTAETPSIGQRMNDSTIYCGVSPHTNLAFYTLACIEEPRLMEWEEARRMAQRMHNYGYWDWRLPTLDELILMRQERNALEDFDGTTWYWASAPHYLGTGWALNFATGQEKMLGKHKTLHVRCVRGPDPYKQ